MFVNIFDVIAVEAAASYAGAAEQVERLKREMEQAHRRQVDAADAMRFQVMVASAGLDD